MVIFSGCCCYHSFYPKTVFWAVCFILFFIYGQMNKDSLPQKKSRTSGSLSSCSTFSLRRVTTAFSPSLPNFSFDRFAWRRSLTFPIIHHSKLLFSLQALDVHSILSLIWDMKRQQESITYCSCYPYFVFPYHKINLPIKLLYLLPNLACIATQRIFSSSLVAYHMLRLVFLPLLTSSVWGLQLLWIFS